MRIGIALLLAVPAFGHWPWIEPEGRLHFGVFPADKMSGARIEAFQSAEIWGVDTAGKYSRTSGRVEGDALVLGDAEGYAMRHTYGVYAGHGPATLVLFSAKAFRGKPAADSPAVFPLDIVATGGGRFRLLRNGKPLANATVHAYTAKQSLAHKAEKHEHKGESGEVPDEALKAVTNARGEFSLAMREAGAWQLHAMVREETPGVHEGKPYATVTLVATLRFNRK